MAGTLYYGDNLEVMRRHLDDGSVDLVYLDPPFQSGRDYDALFETRHEARAPARITAFEDTWSWGPQADAAYRQVTARGGEVGRAMTALEGLLGESKLMAYLAMMAPRLLELHRVLGPTGSLFLHCDPRCSHYLKLLLDAVFGVRCFRNEIVWRYRRWPARSRQLQRMHDIILFYSKSDAGEHKFHTLYGFEKLAESTVKTFGTKKQRADFSSGHRKPSTVAEDTAGPPLCDVWDIGVLAPISKERLGYPTQKPEALLERILRCASEKGDVVLDPFCGCGTALAVAERLKRDWIGVDVTHLAINLVRHRLRSVGPGESPTWPVVGEPASLEGAMALAARDRWQFQWWALGLVGARPADQRKGADHGVDGRLSFQVGKRTESVVVAIDCEGTGAARIADLRGVLERDGAAVGVLLTLHSPTGAMLAEAARAGHYQSPEGTYPRVQILSLGELLQGKGIDCPA